MIETIKKEWQAQVALLLFAVFTVWWFYLQMFLPIEHPAYGWYGHWYGIIALWGAIWGLVISIKWGGLKSVMGRALLMFSLGLFLQEFGQVAYTYYIFVLGVDIPYPSIGDIGFFGTIPCYIYGAFLLAKVSGVKVSLRSFENKLQAIIIPAIMVGLAYFLFLSEYALDLADPLKVFLDFGYPLGQAIYISIAILTYSMTRNILGGIMRPKVLFIIVAFIIQFLADYSFIYFQAQYYPGHLIDYVYTLAYIVMTLGIIQLFTVYKKLQHS